ncbi:hypothetical protein DMC30DRAFT_418517 [Rhodotorula diobovata]|uniref:Uncharacterized protein n=1 Tax=Rhodotorula diobovata TaxID=5288 RepID=A0A5C5FPM2_9BASI|nr:hypothetical protein DMC30DRAFT_418517 [Rhodotorula diobovata]
MALPDQHPDGDPFAERDAQQAASSWLGRMEQRALAEESGHASSAPSSPSIVKPSGSGFAAPRPGPIKRESSGGGAGGGGGGAAAAKSTKPRQSLGTDSTGKEILIVDSEESDEDDGDHEDADEDEEEDGTEGEGESGDGSGTEGEGDEGSDTPQVRGVDDEDDDDDDEDDDDDDSDDDSSSNASGPAGRTGDDVDMADGASSSKHKPPKKVVRAPADGDAEMQDGEADKEGEGEGEGDGEGDKPKKKRRRRQHSPTPPPLEHKDRKTIRLSVTLPPRKAPDVFEVNVHELAKEAGFISEDEEPPKVDEAEAGKDDGQDKGAAAADGAPAVEGGENVVPPPKKRRKRGPNVVLGRFGGYDVNDPFVDDAEIGLYEPRSFARPKRDGYFIQNGPVEVLGRRGRVKGSKNKPKFDENGKPIQNPSSRRKSNKIVVGPDGKPMHVPDDGPSTESGLPPGAGSPFPPKKERAKGEFSQELQDDFEMLKREVRNTVWEQKNKFPPDLKETLIGVAFHALRLDEYDEDFFAVMPGIFHYNLFTMKKLIKREVYSGRIADLTNQQDALLDTVAKQIEVMYPSQRQEYLAKLDEWDRKQAEGPSGTAGGGGGFGGTGARRTPEPPGVRAPGFGNSPAIATPALGALEGAAADSPAPDKGDDEDKDSGEPKWRFRFNDVIRDALYKVGEIEDKKSELTVEKQTYEKSKDKAEKPYSGKNARKLLYQRARYSLSALSLARKSSLPFSRTQIVKLWPAEDVTTNQVSREISNYKLKLKKAGLLPAEPGKDAAPEKTA